MYTYYTSFIIPCQKYDDMFNILEEKILKQNKNYIEEKNYNFINKTIYCYAQWYFACQLENFHCFLAFIYSEQGLIYYFHNYKVTNYFSNT